MMARFSDRFMRAMLFFFFLWQVAALPQSQKPIKTVSVLRTSPRPYVRAKMVAVSTVYLEEKQENRMNNTVMSIFPRFAIPQTTPYDSIENTRLKDTTIGGTSKKAPNIVLNPLQENLSKPVSPGLHIVLKNKILNFWGILHVVMTMGLAALVLPFMYITSIFCDVFGNKKQRRIIDWIIHYWAKFSILLSFGQATVYGLENLPPHDETVVYVPNHTSFLDILFLSGFVPRAFKYLSKVEVLDIPIVGWGMKIAKHVFLKRNDIKSTIECGELCTQRLKDGNSMVLFAEGTRSLDGRLKMFKKGAFQMAKNAGVRVVPVSIGNLHRVMPPSCALPITSIRHAFVKIHPPISTADKTVKEIKRLCHEAVNSGLPVYQRQQEESSSNEE